MKSELIRITEHNFLGKLEYYLNTSFDDDFPGVELYGVTIINKDETESVENVDFDKTRIIEFINCLADAFVTPQTLFDLCEDYVEMLTDRSMR